MISSWYHQDIIRISSGYHQDIMISSRYHVTISLHFLTLRFVIFCYDSLQFVTIRYIWLHLITFRHITTCYFSLQFVTIRDVFVTIRDDSWRFRYNSLRFVTFSLQFVTIRDVFVTIRYDSWRFCYISLLIVKFCYILLHYDSLIFVTSCEYYHLYL